MSRSERTEAELKNEEMIEIYHHRSDIEKKIAALSRAENPTFEMTLYGLVKAYDDMRTDGSFSDEAWRKAFPFLSGSYSPQSSVIAINDAGSLQGDLEETLLPQTSKVDSFIRCVSRGQQYRAVATRLYHAVIDFILAFPRENLELVGDINLVLLAIACAFPAIRFTLTSIQIGRYVFNYDHRMSDFEKSLPISLKLKDQLARNWPVLSQDFVWFMLRGAACLRQDLALLFTLGLFSFLLSRNAVIDRHNNHTFQRIIATIENEDEKNALRKLQYQVAAQDNIALGVAAFYTLGASLATIEYFQKIAALLVAGGSIIGLTALFNFVYEVVFKQSTTKLAPFADGPITPFDKNRYILFASPPPALEKHYIDTAITSENTSPRSSDH